MPESTFNMLDAVRQANAGIFSQDPLSPGARKTSAIGPFDMLDVIKRADTGDFTFLKQPPAKPEKPRGVIAETVSALASGVVQTGEAIAGTVEMLGVPGAGSAREYLQELQENSALKRPDYLKEETVWEHPKRMGDWRWWVRSLGENLPNMVTMMLPGYAALRGAQAANWGAKAIRGAALTGAWSGSMTLEAGSAYTQAKQEMAQAGTFDADTIERVATMEGLAAGTVNSLIELLPFDNLFLKQAGADRLVKRFVRQAFLEGSTESAQEGVNILVEKLGHKPDQTLLDNIGRILESGIIGGALGGAAGGTIGTSVHKKQVKQYNSLAEQLGVKDAVFALKDAGVTDQEIAAQLDTRINEIRTKLEETPPGADAITGGTEVKDIAQKQTIPEVDGKEMVSYLLYGDGKYTPPPGTFGRAATKTKKGVLGMFGMKETIPVSEQQSGQDAVAIDETATGTTAGKTTTDPGAGALASGPQAGKDVALAEPLTKAINQGKKAENRKKGQDLFTAALSELNEENQQALEQARLAEITRRDAEESAAAEAAAQTQQIQVDQAVTTRDTLRSQLAGDDPVKQKIFDETFSLSEKRLVSALAVSPTDKKGPGLGLIITPDDRGLYQLNGQPVDLNTMRPLLVKNRIAAVDAKREQDIRDRESNILSEELNRKRKAVTSARKTLSFWPASRPSDSDIALLQEEASQGRLPEDEKKVLDKILQTSAVAETIPQSLQIMGIKSKEAPITDEGIISEEENKDYVRQSIKTEEDEDMHQYLLGLMESQLQNAGSASMIARPDDTFTKVPAGVDWLTAVNKQGMSVSKNDALTVIKKAQTGAQMTEKQKDVYAAIVAAASERIPGHILEEPFWAERGFNPVRDKQLAVTDLLEGDRFVIFGEEFTVTDIDDQGTVTLKDGTIRKVKDGTIIKGVDYLKQAEDATEFEIEGSVPEMAVEPEAVQLEAPAPVKDAGLEAKAETPVADKVLTAVAKVSPKTGDILTGDEFDALASDALDEMGKPAETNTAPEPLPKPAPSQGVTTAVGKPAAPKVVGKNHDGAPLYQRSDGSMFTIEDGVEKPLQPPPKAIGKNPDGLDIYTEGPRRYIIENGVKQYESVKMVPTHGGMQTTIDEKNRPGTYLTEEERKPAKAEPPGTTTTPASALPDLTVTGQQKPVPDHPEAGYVVHHRKPDLLPDTFKVVISRRQPFVTIAGTGMDAGSAYRSALSQYERKVQQEESTKTAPKEVEGAAFQQGERVVLKSGRHGIITKVDTVTMQSIGLYGGGRSENRSHYYQVKSDSGTEFHASEADISREEGIERPSVIPDIKIDNRFMEPDHVLDHIQYRKQKARDFEAAAQRARKPSSVTEHKSRAEGYRQEAAAAQRQFDEWAGKYPEEAKKYLPEKTAPSRGVAIATGQQMTPVTTAQTTAAMPSKAAGNLGDLGLVVTKGATNTGKTVWNVSGNTREHSETIKKAGGRWYGPKKVWSFYNGDPTPELMERLGIRPGTTIVEEKPTEKQTSNPPVKFQIGDQVRPKPGSGISEKSGGRIQHIQSYQDGGQGIKTENTGNMHFKAEDFDLVQPAPSLGKAASEVAAGVASSYDAIAEIMKRAGKGPISMMGTGVFDEELYQAIKPHLQATYDHFRAAAIEVKDWMKETISQFGARGFEPQAILPYIKRFYMEVTTSERHAGEPDIKPFTSIAANVQNAIAKKQPITWQQLGHWADTAFAGTMAEGKYSIKDAYDAMEMGVNQYIGESLVLDPTMNIVHAKNMVEALQKMTDTLLPTQTRRTAEMDEFQQFSTPPALAYIANWAANLKTDDIYLEPSAGTGDLAIFAKNAKVKETIVNEIAPRRVAILRELGFDQVFAENGEQLHNILPAEIVPTVIVMNPPFSSTAGRKEGSRDTREGMKHIDQALKRLAPNGRLVAIIGESISSPTHRVWWDGIEKENVVRANIGISGKSFAKYGTDYDTRIIIIDKIKPGDYTKITGKVEKLTELLPLIEGVRNDRQEATRTGRESQPASDQQISAKTPPAGEVSSRPGIPARPATDLGATGEGSGVGVGSSGARTTGQPLSSLEPGGRGNISATRPNQTEPGPGRPGAELPGSIRQQDERNRTGLPAGESAALTAVNQAEQPHEAFSASIYENYRPEKVTIAGAKPHPGKLVQSASMAGTPPPAASYQPNIPKNIIETGKLSDAQLEAIIYAGQAHQEHLDTGERKGFFIGDGTGVGKGREIAGIIYDNWNQGRKKAVWISEKTSLVKDAKRDIGGIGWTTAPLLEHRKIKPGNPLNMSRGILFTTYSTLKSKERKMVGGVDMGKTRLAQITAWLGADFDGVIIFDESHNMGNAVAQRGNRGTQQASQQALAGLALQAALPQARIVYVSATGATEISNLAYAQRLGLWGPGTSFGDMSRFINSIAQSGLAGMELVARDMKAMGNYISRSLSFEDVTYGRLEHPLTDKQKEIYDQLAVAWQTVLENIDAALATTQANAQGKSAAKSAFWGAHQRFFNQIITSMQMPSVITAAKKDIADGNAVVMQLVNTNEASQERAMARMEEGDELDDLDLTPRDHLMTYIEHSFPVQQYEEYTDENGNPQTRKVVDSNGNPVLNADAVRARDALLERLGSIAVPDGPLEIVLNQLGADKVSEVTGRGRRIVINKEGKKVEEKRTRSVADGDADAFMNDKKQILVFSDAGGTGRSYHADNTVVNRRKRVHYLVQPGWRSDKAVQGLGRTHRTNQANAPHYILVTTDLKGQSRFISSIARRLDQLGALTKGQRQTGSQGIFQARDNLESTYAQEALRRFFIDLAHNDIPGLDIATFERETGLNLRKADGGLRLDLPPIRQFLNRLLSMTYTVQNRTFDHFSDRLDAVIRMHESQGTLDAGLETLRADKVEKVNEQVVYTDERTGAETKYVELDVSYRTKRFTFQDAANLSRPFYRNIRSGNVWVVASESRQRTTESGNIEEYRALRAANYHQQPVNTSDLNNTEKWETITPDEARDPWQRLYDKTPVMETERRHLITGAILPIWDRIDTGHMRIMRVQTETGEKMVGRLINDGDLTRVLQNLGATTSQINATPQEIVRRITQGYRIRLSNGWSIAKRRVSGNDRIELIGPDYSDNNELSRAGVFTERISFKTRYFIPTGDQDADIIERLTARRPVVDITREAGTSQNSLDNDAGSRVQENREGYYEDISEGKTYPATREQANVPGSVPEGEGGIVYPEIASAVSWRGRVPTRTVHTNHAAAKVARSLIGNLAQEKLLSILLDKNDKIIQIYQHTIGLQAVSQVDPVLIAGQAINTKGATSLYLVHNHPGGEARLSLEDAKVHDGLENLLKGTAVELKNSLAVTPERYSTRSDLISGRTPYLKPVEDGKNTASVPVVERIVAKTGKNLPHFTGAEDAYNYLQDQLPEGGLLLLNIKNQPVGKVAITDYRKIRGEQQHAILSGLEKTNATRIIAYTATRAMQPDETVNLLRFIEATYGRVELLDIIDDISGSWRANQTILVDDRGVVSYPQYTRGDRDFLFAGASGSVRVDAPITVEDAGSVVRDFREMSKLDGVVTLKLSDSFDLLPEEVRKAAEDAGGTQDNTYAVLHKDGSIYLIRDAHATREQLEKSIFHEVYGHLGIFRLFGQGSIQQLARLYNRLGGYQGLAKIADKYGDRAEFDTYWKDAKTETSPEMRNARIAAELLALIGQKSPTLMQKAKEVFGSVREALRRLGLAKLAKYGDSDLAYLLAEGKKALHKAGPGGEFTLLMKVGDKAEKVMAEKVVPAVSKVKNRGLAMMGAKTSPAVREAAGAFAKHWKEFWQPFSTVPDGDKVLAKRYEAMGNVARAVRFIDELFQKVNTYPDQVKKDMFWYLNGDIPIENLPEDVRETAKMIQRRTEVIGEMLVDRGIIAEGQFEKYRGKYIHYMYAKHVLGEDTPIFLTSSGKLNLSYTKSRNTKLTMQQKKELGLIEDASVAVPVGMGKALTDIAKWDYLKSIADNADWVWQPSLIKVPIGKPLATPIRGRTRRNVTMGIGKLVEEAKTYDAMLAKHPTPEVAEIHRILHEALDKAEAASENMPADFVQLPNSKGYGPLAGAFVRKAIADDLMPVLDVATDRGKLMNTILEIERQGMATFKMGKVALNFPTAVRNIISNIIQNNMRGRELSKIPGDIIRACEAMKAKDAYYEEAFGMGIFHTNWFVSEINDVLDEFRKVKGGRIDQILIAVKNVAKYYGKIDDISKLSIFIEQREAGKSIDEATLEAMKWGMDYSLTSRSIKGLRQTIVPFATYQYKIAPLIAESLKKRPWVLAKFGLIYAAAKMLAMGFNDLDDDDWEDLEKQLPAYIKKSGSMMILPWKSNKGQWQWVNLEYFFPWGNYLAIARDMKATDLGEAIRDMGISNPFLSMLYTGLSAREDQPPLHSYFGTPIYNQLDPAPMKAAKLLEYMANIWIPSMFTRQGAIGYTGRAIAGGEDRWGREVSAGQALGRWFGVNIVSVSPEQTRAQASVRIQDLRKEQSRIEANPSYDEEDKAAYAKRLNEKLAEIAQEAPAAVLPITKAKGKDPVYEALQAMAAKGILHTAPPSRSVEIAGIPFKMTMDQYGRYLEQTSEIARKRLLTLVDSETWETMSDKRKSDAVSGIVANARKGIRQRIKIEISRENQEKIREAKMAR